ncbi:DUF4252 domain-containing protein [Flavobacterium sp. MFBS3-15]|uniref:DUF4252 domain-containing protein n=1 Tax=Flavobacterium sp. MFBS3-15 TaxID=2989816 RepID=UPI00223689FD|nr:DUF4252 domain-containing protein [Flavobacterium sp. MFBS3-15]MCW4467533.1 DUF4252 domain-containing protein [Flavobacterium sp. MFBS3-15]
MKKFIITAVMAAMPFVTFAQTKAFDKFQDVEGISSITVNKEMFEMLGEVKVSDDKKTQSYLDMAENIEGLKVFTTKEKKHKDALRASVAEYIKKNPLTELMSINQDGQKVKIYAAQGKTESIIKEGLIFVEGGDDKDLVLVSFTGTLNLNDIEGLKK